MYAHTKADNVHRGSSPRSWGPAVLAASLAIVPLPCAAQTIDFETLPDGTPTEDEQPISDQYAPFGVTFTLVDRTTGDPIGPAFIAKAGPPLTAFVGCYDDDLPYDGQGLGESFLTDASGTGVSADLLIRFSPPVSRSSGAILDVDCRTNGGPPCEQWTITARDAQDAVLDTRILDAPQGAINPECTQPGQGPGDSVALPWSFDLPGQQIASVLLKYTGAASDVGLAFDRFVVAGEPAPLSVSVLGPSNASCAGQTVELRAEPEGTWPFAYQWQQEVSPGSWTDLGTTRSQLVAPTASTDYRVTVTDGTTAMATSVPFTVAVVSGSGQPACDERLLVSSFNTDRVLRYDPVTMTFVDTFVGAGSGGLDGASGLSFGPGGDLFVASQNNDSVLRYDGQTGAFVDVFVPSGSGGLDVPVGVKTGPDGNLYVSSVGTRSVKRYDGQTGSYLGDFVAPGSGGLSQPTGLVFGPDGNLYVSSLATNSVNRYDGQTGAFIDAFVAAGAGGLSQPRGLIFGPDGDLFVGGQTTNDVKRFDGLTGEPLGAFVASGSGTLDRANDLVFDRLGHLHVASFDNDKVLRYGALSGEWIDGFPTGSGLDAPAWIVSTLFCGDGTCEPGTGETVCSCAADCGAAPGSEAACGDGFDGDCDGSVDCADADCSADAACASASAVPDGSTVPGGMLSVDKAAGDELTLSWDDACASGDSDYEVYEGWIGAFQTHLPVTCTTGGALFWTFAPSAGNNYYLVVPSNGASEGSYGLTSGAAERPSSPSACLQQITGACD